MSFNLIGIEPDRQVEVAFGYVDASAGHGGIGNDEQKQEVSLRPRLAGCELKARGNSSTPVPSTVRALKRQEEAALQLTDGLSSGPRLVRATASKSEILL
jgi:hypothetical protein